MESEDASGGLPWFEEFDWSQINNDAWQEGVSAQAQLAGQGAPAHQAGMGIVMLPGNMQDLWAELNFVVLNAMFNAGLFTSVHNRQSRG